MPNNTDHPAFALTSGGELTTNSGPQRIATRMAENLLTNARNQERALAGQQRYWIGGYEFREADHEQIQRWARMLGMTPEVVVEGLANSKKKKPYEANEIEDTDFLVRDGSMVSLVWDFALFPLADWAWVDGLEIVRLAILNSLNGQLPKLPRCIRDLVCDDCALIALDLKPVSMLKNLHCSKNKLTVLDLTPVPGLLELRCGINKLVHLDLEPVQELKILDCWSNRLTHIDLMPVTGLIELSCGVNQLTHLDLKPVPGLIQLSCWSNSLKNFDLTPVPLLTNLDCSGLKLTRLDLALVPNLVVLNCAYNQLNQLDLAPVPRLMVLDCIRNKLNDIDLSPVPELITLTCDSNVKVTNEPLDLDFVRL